jgi:putative ABC transport system substrate-binding protein
VEGRNLLIEARFAERKLDRLPGLADELVRLNVDVIVTVTTPAAIAVKKATATIPIVMSGVADPVELGLVASLARPGGNATGVTNNPGSGFAGKQLQLLKEAAPAISRVAVIWNSSIPPEVRAFRGDMQTAAQALGLTLVSAEVQRAEGLADAFAAIGRERADALHVFPSTLNYTLSREIVEFATRHRLPSMFGGREFVEAGGLMCYWTSWSDLRRRTAVYVDRILKGTKPADLPVEEPSKFDFVVNLKTARALGLTIPPSVLVRADQVIE